MDKALNICEQLIQNNCKQPNCPLQHHKLPYLWQVMFQDSWHSLLHETPAIEEAFCNPAIDSLPIQVTAFNHSNGTAVPVQMCLLFNQMEAEIALAPSNHHKGSIRRLSTPSYAKLLNKRHEVRKDDVHLVSCVHLTQWRWYWQDGNVWKAFEQVPGTPLQSVLEAKFLHGQEVYRFEVDHEPGAADTHTFIIHFTQHKMQDMSGRIWRLKRRPLLISQQDLDSGKVLESTSIKDYPIPVEVPDDWYPLDTKSDYELVPLNPDSVQFHLIASEFVRSLPQGREICDIFKIQNAFLWHKYHCKKLYMSSQGRSAQELQLFHGTAQPTVVQAIFRQNFDWRVSGKNATMYGKGAYFARDAAFSDRYTGSEKSAQVKWMFLVRVLVGQYTLGKADFSRPPPLDPNKPHGAMYDSCVNDVNNPKIYVIFDSDQYYPEYVISYKHNQQAQTLTL